MMDVVIFEWQDSVRVRDMLIMQFVTVIEFGTSNSVRDI